MKITVQYEAQARRAAGISSETIEISDRCCVNDCVRNIADAHDEQLRMILVNSDGDVQPSLLMFLNDAQIVRNDSSMLSDGDTLTLMTPISGG